MKSLAGKGKKPIFRALFQKWHTKRGSKSEEYGICQYCQKTMEDKEEQIIHILYCKHAVK